MKTHKRGASSARVVGGRVAEVVYTGPLCKQSFFDLRGQIGDAAVDAESVIIRFDIGLILINEPLPTEWCSVSRAPGSYIVRPDQYELFKAQARALACEKGVIRTVFLAYQLELAYQIAELSTA